MDKKLTEEQLIQQKVDLTQMQLEALENPDGIIDLIRNTLDTETILYVIQLNALNKLRDIFFTLEQELERLTRKNEQLKVNNSVLAGMADNDTPELTDEEKEYEAIMSDSEGE